MDSMQVPVATIVHPTAVISPNARVAKGTSVFANAVINTNASVGVGCIVNTSAIVEHDCVVGDYVNICPKAAMAGRTRIGGKTESREVSWETVMLLFIVFLEKP